MAEKETEKKKIKKETKEKQKGKTVERIFFSIKANWPDEYIYIYRYIYITQHRIYFAWYKNEEVKTINVRREIVKIKKKEREF